MVYSCVIIAGLGVGVDGREDDAETRDARRETRSDAVRERIRELIDNEE